MKSDWEYFVYIMANQRHTVLYVGMTSGLPGRVKEHKEKRFKKSFSAKYNIDKLVHYEIYNNVEEAILRERQLKAGSRQKKIDLINTNNPEWKDLSDDWEL